MCSFQSSHLLGHFTSNCCGCLDTRLMMQPGLEIILMSLLIRKNSKIANFHCPDNTKYTQKISIHSDSGFDSTEFQEILRNDSDSKNCGPKSHDNTSLLLQMKKRPIPKIQSVSQYSFEVGSDGFLSPGSSMFDNFMPCGISTPEITRF